VRNGVRYAYTGNVVDPRGQSTWCHWCGGLLIGRDWYELGAWNLTPDGYCASCGERVAGVFEAAPGAWGSRRMPVRLGAP
jgi:pyruvate formate lyase activating enzyme